MSIFKGVATFEEKEKNQTINQQVLTLEFMLQDDGM